MTDYDQLNYYIQAEVFKKAGDWRAKNHVRILEMIRTHVRTSNTSPIVKPRQPSGAAVYEPEKWTAENWLWFGQLLVRRHTHHR